MFRSEDGRRSTALANASKSRRFSGTANASKVERVSGIHPPHPPAYTQERAGRLPPSCQARALTAERPGRLAGALLVTGMPWSVDPPSLQIGHGGTIARREQLRL